MNDYPHLLRCLDHKGSVKYELPAHFSKEMRGYWMYSRPVPLVYHKKKQKEFLLPYPEVVLVSQKECHCISIAHKQGEPVNMYVNINHIPTEHETGYEWLDLELDLVLSRKEGSWHYQLVDEDEFEEANLSSQDRQTALDEVQRVITKITSSQFPFCLDKII